jgi:DNA-binding MarR family transcriptional regulator
MINQFLEILILIDSLKVKHKLTSSQIRVLFFIAANRSKIVTISYISQSLELTASNSSNIIQVLKSKQLILNIAKQGNKTAIYTTTSKTNYITKQVTIQLSHILGSF